MVKCEKAGLSRKRIMEFKKEKEAEHGIIYGVYKCRICFRYHLTTQDKRIKDFNNKGTKSSRATRRFNERRRVYRKNFLPIESWENEGGAVLD